MASAPFPSPASPAPDLLARDFVSGTGPDVDSATRLARAASTLLEVRKTVWVGLQGVRGLTSSYFNALLSEVARTNGREAIRSALQFVFDSKAQQFVYERSLEAVLNSPDVGV